MRKKFVEKRNTLQRRHHIVELLNSQGEVSVDTLSRHFSTSEVTIRKDLGELENSGLLIRRHGGAIPLPQEIVNEANTSEVSKRKIAIAKAAAECIRDHYRIVIDAGTTTGALLPELSQFQGLVVMTNSLDSANSLRELENEPTILMTGGTWDKRSESFQGNLAEQILKSYDFDQLFVGADGVDAERGTTTYNEFWGLSRCMAEVSREVIVMVESNKLQRKIPNLELSWSTIDVLVTDDDISKADKKIIEEKGVRVICAAPMKSSPSGSA